MFGGVQFPDGTFAIDFADEFMEHQKVFMEVVSEIRSHNIFTFPVLTYSLLFQNDKFVDEEFARWCSDHNTVWNDSNFFQSDNVGTLSNCCFDGSQNAVIKFGDDEVTDSIKNIYDRYKDEVILIYDKGEFKSGKVIRSELKPMYKIITEDGREIKVTVDHINPTKDGDKKTTELKVGDELPVWNDGAIIYDAIASIDRYEYDDGYTYCFEMGNQDDPYFTLANGIETHNCRLLSDTTKLDAFVNSIGGTALSIGSVKVNTINLMRIAYETNFDKNKYLRRLRKRTTLCCKTLDVIRHIIERNVEKGLLPNYCEGGIEMSKQYATCGVLGLFEVIESFGLTERDEFGNVSYTDEGLEFASKIFEVINDVKDNFTDEYSFNIESVPAERAAVILCQKDNLLFEKNEKFIYSNQWIPLSEKCTIKEKIRLSAILDAKCSGGAIAHINLEKNFPNKDVAWDMLNYIARNHVFYFAFNTRINECASHHGFVGTDICPQCGGEVVDTYQRIVGFLEPRRSYSKDRKREFDTRQWYSYAQMKGEI